MFRGPHTRETREKIANARRGQRMSIESRKKLSANHNPNSNRSGDLAPNWRGGKAEYQVLHDWVRSVNGLPELCQACGRDNTETWVEWASIDGKYLRDKDEWITLCRRCHQQYDKGSQKSKEVFAFDDRRYYGRK